MTPEAIDMVKQSAAVLGPQAEALTRLFYLRMFDENPEVEPFFNPAHQAQGTQQKALAGAIVAYATHIEDLSALGPAVELIAHKHVSLGVRPEHYPIVGKHLLASIRALLGPEVATDALIDAWAAAYGQLVEVVTGREAQLYAEQESRHGWTGFRPFEVVRRVRESDEIVSLYLEPVDGGAIGDHQAGQYLTLRLPHQGTTTMRNYSISSGPGRRHLRISVKREGPGVSGAPVGYGSNRIHDTLLTGDRVEVAPPSGCFVLDPAEPAARPLVLLAGGVGVTPLLSMLHAAVEGVQSGVVDRDVVFVQAARNGSVHAFAGEVADLANRSDRVAVHHRYSAPTPQDVAARCFDSVGLIDQALLENLMPSPDADVYFCGPPPFMDAVATLLRDWGVPEAQIFFESFGPQRVPGQHATQAQAPAGCPFHAG